MTAMTKITNVREAALDALTRIEKNQSYSNLLLNEIIKSKQVPPADISLFTQIVYGTIQQKKRLDFVLASFSIKPLEKLEPWVLQLLRLSLYQLIFLDRVPDHAVLNEAVNIAKTKGHKGIAGMVNGILRSYLREGAPSLESIKDPLKQLAVETSHPEWMIDRWIKDFGEVKAVSVANANNQPPFTSVRINYTVTDKKSVLEELGAEGLQVEESPLLESALRIKKGAAASTKAFKEGRISIQDEASMLAGLALAPEEDEQILDACAAPGGKTVHIAELLNHTGAVTSMDIHDHKVKLVKEQADRLHLKNVQAITGDARKIAELPLFDRILIDAPCSGLGVIQRKPDMKWTKKEEDVNRLAVIQQDILHHIWQFLKPGGELIYSTCTIDAAENQNQIERFLSSTDDAEANKEMIDRLPAMLKEQSSDGSSLQLLPGEFGTDGFFISALKKKQN